MWQSQKQGSGLVKYLLERRQASTEGSSTDSRSLLEGACNDSCCVRSKTDGSARVRKQCSPHPSKHARPTKRCVCTSNRHPRRCRPRRSCTCTTHAWHPSLIKMWDPHPRETVPKRAHSLHVHVKSILPKVSQICPKFGKDVRSKGAAQS